MKYTKNKSCIKLVFLYMTSESNGLEFKFLEPYTAILGISHHLYSYCKDIHLLMREAGEEWARETVM